MQKCIGTLNRREYGKVKTAVMKSHAVLQALANSQAHSKNLKLYEQIELSEQGKVPNVSKPTKNNKRLNRYSKVVLEPKKAL